MSNLSYQQEQEHELEQEPEPQQNTTVIEQSKYVKIINSLTKQINNLQKYVSNSELLSYNRFFGLLIFGINVYNIKHETNATTFNEYVLLIAFSHVKAHIYGSYYPFSALCMMFDCKDMTKFSRHLIPGSVYGPDYLRK